MRSLRLDPHLDQRLQQAAAVKGESVSEFIRYAVAKRAEETLGSHPRELFADVAGAIRGRGGRARRTGDAFADALVEDRSTR